MSNSVRPHRRQSTRLPRSWDSPGKNTGVGCHFLLQCTKVKNEREVAQSNPMDCSLPGSSVHGIFQVGILESGAIAFSGPAPIQIFFKVIPLLTIWTSSPDHSHSLSQYNCYQNPYILFVKTSG